MYADVALQMGFIPIPLVGKCPTYPGWPGITKEHSLTIIINSINSNKCNNIGVICGQKSGIVVVDIDIKDDGLELWYSLCQQHGIPDTFTIMTGSGGFHYYFKYDDRTSSLRNLTRAIQGKGIDVKTNSGQVVYWGSIHPDSRKRYECTNGIDGNTVNIAHMPQWLLDLLLPKAASLTKEDLFAKMDLKYKSLNVDSTPTPRTSGDPPTSEETTSAEADSSSVSREMMEELIDLLAFNRSDNHDFWMTGVFAIKNTNPDFIDLAHTFSMKSPKYDEKRVNNMWKDAKKPDKPVTFATLMYWLKEDTKIERYTEFTKKWFGRTRLKHHDLYQIYIYDNDFGLRDYFVKAVKDVCICTSIECDKFYLWNEEQLLWRRGDHNILVNKVRTVVTEMLNQVIDAFEKDLAKFAKDMAKAKEDKKVENLAKMSESVKHKLKECQAVYKRVTQTHGATAVARLCSEPLFDDSFEDRVNAMQGFLPVRNGLVIDLRTGESRKRTKEDLFTIECPVSFNPAAPMDDVLRYAEDISIGNDKEMLQTVLGHAITGDTTAQKIIILHNPQGGASKSTLMNFLSGILGEFFQNAERSVAFKNKRALQTEGGHSTYLVQLEEKRVVGFCESNSSANTEECFNEAILKMVTGGDQVSGREIMQKAKKLKLWFTPFIIVNKLPEVSNEEAFWRRLVPILMKARFVSNPDPEDPFQRKADPQFTNRLKTEENKSAFLNWLIVGARRFYADGFPNTPDILEYQLRYKMRNDSVLEFLYTKCVIGRNRDWQIDAKTLFERFDTWKSSYLGEDKRPILSQRRLCEILNGMELLTSLPSDDDLNQEAVPREVVKLVKIQLGLPDRRVAIRYIRFK